MGTDAERAESENRLGGLTAPTMPQKKTIERIVEESEAFCRQALRMLAPRTCSHSGNCDHECSVCRDSGDDALCRLDHAFSVASDPCR